MSDETTLFDVTLFKQAQIEQTIKEVYQALMQRGYDPIKQLVGYLISGDPGYISSFNDARRKIQSLDREVIVAFLLEEYLK